MVSDPKRLLSGARCPVVMQEAGFTEHYGDSNGLFGFRSLGEIVEAVRAINADYACHARRRPGDCPRSF